MGDILQILTRRLRQPHRSQAQVTATSPPLTATMIVSVDSWHGNTVALGSAHAINNYGQSLWDNGPSDMPTRRIPTMSMPCAIFCCDTCDFQRYNTVLWGNYAYLIDGVKVSLNRQLAWCLECNSFAAVEDFSDLGERVSALTRAVKSHTASMQNRSVFTLLAEAVFPYRRRESTRAIQELEQLAFRIDLIRARKGQERCLKCGSTDWIPFGEEAINGVRAVGARSDAPQKTGFKHPGCGGEILAKPNPWRSNMAFTPLRYGPDGGRIDS